MGKRKNNRDCIEAEFSRAPYIAIKDIRKIMKTFETRFAVKTIFFFSPAHIAIFPCWKERGD